MKNIDPSLIENVIDFLVDNEQYGDDWSEEIDTLRRLVDIVDANQ